MYHNCVEFILGMHMSSSIFKNQSAQSTKLAVYSSDHINSRRKNFQHNSMSIHELHSQQTRNRRKFPQSGKEHVNKTPATTIIINDETLGAFSQIWRNASDVFVTAI